MKWATNEEDTEDYEQELAIKEWIESQGINNGFDFKHINNKGNARNTLIKAAISLDQEIGDEGGSKFSDLVAGFDGRDLENGRYYTEFSEPDPIEVVDQLLLGLGFKEGEIQCIKKILKSSIKLNEIL